LRYSKGADEQNASNTQRVYSERPANIKASKKVAAISFFTTLEREHEDQARVDKKHKNAQPPHVMNYRKPFGQPGRHEQVIDEHEQHSDAAQKV
jgi:hypothetical protein